MSKVTGWKYNRNGRAYAKKNGGVVAPPYA